MTPQTQVKQNYKQELIKALKDIPLNLRLSLPAEFFAWIQQQKVQAESKI